MFTVEMLAMVGFAAIAVWVAFTQLPCPRQLEEDAGDWLAS